MKSRPSPGGSPNIIDGTDGTGLPVASAIPRRRPDRVTLFPKLAAKPLISEHECHIFGDFGHSRLSRLDRIAHVGF